MRKGQFTIIGLLMVFITLIAFFALAPVLTNAISTGTTAANMTGGDLLISQNLTTIILLAIIMSILSYLAINRQQGGI